ncbi:phosphoglycerate dehydrogenase [Acidobacteria bacterium AH-259-D05]|nr:phosphoglycerate dehydrogenase [Acidobacteria bacterium AH-259-D05]
MESLKSAGLKVVDNPFKRKLTKDELLELLSPDVIGLVAGLEPLDREVLEGSNLKVISRVGSGLSNVDLEAARDLDIEVCFTPWGPTRAVAELTLCAMLSLMRRLPEMDRDLHEGEWNKKIGFQLEGKTVAIIGFGRIGKCVAELLSSFNTRILVVDPFIETSEIDYPVSPLEEALPLADVITIHSSGDECVIGENQFAIMKKGVYLLNAARGELIAENSLIQALNSGRVAGAWLDTFETEPYTGPLTECEQVILTPHVGSYTYECRKQMETQAVENLINALEPDL